MTLLEFQGPELRSASTPDLLVGINAACGMEEHTLEQTPLGLRRYRGGRDAH